MSQIRLRPLAEADLVERTKYYASQGGDRLGERSFDTAIELLGTIEEMPGSGSLQRSSATLARSGRELRQPDGGSVS